MAFSGVGSGTGGDPYQITTWTQFQEMNDYLGDFSVHFKLMNDLSKATADFYDTLHPGCTFQGEWIAGEYLLNDLVIRHFSEDGGNIIRPAYFLANKTTSAEPPSSIDNLESTDWDSIRGFEPIGLEVSNAGITTVPFSGVFDGNHKVMSDFYARVIDDESSDYIRQAMGVFGSVKGEGWVEVSPGISAFKEAVIKNFGVWNGYVLGSREPVGLLVAKIRETKVENCFAGGLSSSMVAGGLVGGAMGSTIADSYSFVDVSSFGVFDGGPSSSHKIAGLVFFAFETAVYNSYAKGRLHTSYASYGLCVNDYDYGVVRANTFWDTETTGATNNGAMGVGKTTLQMKSIGTFSNTNIVKFQNYVAQKWKIADTDGVDYPLLGWETPVSFADYDLICSAKTVNVKDKYDNILISSVLNTLTDSTVKVIKGYSKVKATISVGNKMTVESRRGSEPLKYLLSTPSKSGEVDYSDIASVEVEVDNVLVKDFTVSAIDTFNYTKKVNKSLTSLIDYQSISTWGLKMERESSVLPATKLSFTGKVWKGFFGGGADGVENNLVIEYRFKESTAVWGAQVWSSITPTVDVDGNISFDDYVNGDLGVDGFDADKSFTIELRSYDRLSHSLLEEDLSVGIPVVDFHKDGMAIKGSYDEGVGGHLQLLGKNILDIIHPIGSIYFNAEVDTNPAILKGFGTWELWGSGKVPVGVDTGDVDFDDAEKTGGAKTHTLSTAELPAHLHGISFTSGSRTPGATGGPSNNTSGTQSANHRHTGPSHTHRTVGAVRIWRAVSGTQTLNTANDPTIFKGNVTSGVSHPTTGTGGTGVTGWVSANHTHSLQSHTHTSAAHTHAVSGNTGNAGSGNAHNNLPPYITVFMWKRIS